VRPSLQFERQGFVFRGAEVFAVDESGRLRGAIFTAQKAIPLLGWRVGDPRANELSRGDGANCLEITSAR